MKLNHIEKMKNTQAKVDNYQENFHEIPEFPDGENKCLGYASNKVKMRYVL
jgi:hypothetical protein